MFVSIDTFFFKKKKKKKRSMNIRFVLNKTLYLYFFSMDILVFSITIKCFFFFKILSFDDVCS